MTDSMCLYANCLIEPVADIPARLFFYHHILTFQSVHVGSVDCYGVAIHVLQEFM
jgi:hypothetical protein